MSEQDKTGGPAFPTLTRIIENYMDEAGYGRSREVGIHVGGMTLRDYFAAKAMQGELSSMTDPDIGGLSLTITSEGLANLAKHWHRIADAMMEARKS